MDARHRKVIDLVENTERAFYREFITPIVRAIREAGSLIHVYELDKLDGIGNQVGVGIRLAERDWADNPEAAKLVAQAISTNVKIEILHLGLSGFERRENGDIKCIMDAVSAIPNLKAITLDLSRLNLDQQEVACIAETLAGRKNMLGMNLDLHFVNMSAQSVVRLLAAVRVARPIYCSAQLYYPSFGSDGIDRVLEAMRSNTAVTRLGLDGAISEQQASIRDMCIVRNQLLFKYRDQPEVCQKLLAGCEQAGFPSEPVPKLTTLIRMFSRTDAGKKVFDFEAMAKDVGEENAEAQKDLLKFQDLLSPDEVTDALLKEKDNLSNRK